MSEVLVPPMPGLVPHIDPAAPGTESTSPNPFPAKEELRVGAQRTLDIAILNLAAEKKKVESAQQAKLAAQAILDAARPNIMLAEAQVTIAKAHLLQFGALPKGEGGGKVTFDQVIPILQGAPSQMTVEDIRAALAEQDINSSADNLKTYLSRWAAAGAVLKGEKNNRLEPARYYAPPVANGVTAPPMPGLNAAPTTTPLPEDFPGREWLEKVGITTKEDLAGSTIESLTEYSGIGTATAKAILKALG